MCSLRHTRNGSGVRGCPDDILDGRPAVTLAPNTSRLFAVVFYGDSGVDSATLFTTEKDVLAHQDKLIQKCWNHFSGAPIPDDPEEAFWRYDQTAYGEGNLVYVTDAELK